MNELQGQMLDVFGLHVDLETCPQDHIFSKKVQMQPPQENMKNIKRKKKCENEVD